MSLHEKTDLLFDAEMSRGVIGGWLPADFAEAAAGQSRANSRRVVAELRRSADEMEEKLNEPS